MDSRSGIKDHAGGTSGVDGQNHAGTISRAGGQDICDRTFAFAVRIVRLCRFLNTQPGVDYVLTKQLLRSGTSIGANVEEAQAGQSDADFISKYGIALKEARETRFWLRLLVEADCVPAGRVDELLQEVEELMRIIAAIKISAGKRRKRQ